MSKCIIVGGNLIDGCGAIIGPFESKVAAFSFGNRTVMMKKWQVAPLEEVGIVSEAGKWLVVYGHPFDGFKFAGPFESEEGVHHWLETNSVGACWYGANLVAPDRVGFDQSGAAFTRSLDALN